jgi:hypothetical protein
MALTEALNFGTQVVLGIKPGPGDVGLARNSVEGDPLAGGVHAPQRCDGAVAGLLGPGGGRPR